MTEENIISKVENLISLKELDDDNTKALIHEIEKLIDRRHRKALPVILKLSSHLERLGAPITAYEILYKEAIARKKRNKKKEYFKLLYLALKAMSMASFTPFVERLLLESIEEIKKNSDLSVFLPYYLTLDAFYHHIYMFSYEVAIVEYLTAKEFLNFIRDEEINELGLPSKRKMEFYITENIIDLYFRLRDNMPEYRKEEMLSEAQKHLKNLDAKDEEEYIQAFLKRIEFHILSHNYKIAEELLNEGKNYISAQNERSFKPCFKRLEARLLREQNKYYNAYSRFVDALQESIYYGNNFLEKLILDDIFNLISKMPARGQLFSSEGEVFLNSMLNLLRSKDFYLGVDHSHEVAQLSVHLTGEVEKITEKEIDLDSIYMAGLLHDIGKLYIPWFILTKPTSLRPIEWEVIQSHPLIGAQVALKLGYPKVAEIIEGHHERIDGSGYPYGKKNLSLETQIVALADLFQAAITPSRIYKKPKTKEEVLEEIKDYGGRKFDAVVVQALFNVVREGKG